MSTGSEEPKNGAKEPPTPAPAAKRSFKLDDLGIVGTILAAVGGGIGVLSFVAFFGAAILWVRMDGAGLPGNEAVAVVPRSVLLSTGATFLVPSLLAALGFTALLYLVESGTIFASTQSLESLEAASQKRREVIEARRTKATEDAREADEAAERARDAKESVPSPVEENVADAKLLAEVGRSKDEAITRALELQREAAKALDQAELEMIEFTQDDEKQRKVVANVTNKRWRRHLRWGLFISLFGVAAGVMFLVFSIGIDPGRFFALAILLVSLSIVCLSILKWTDSFLWFALATFIAVGILSGILTYYRTADNPKVEPAALLRTHGGPVFGFFVAQTSDRIYLGTKPPGGMARLDAIPREEVIALVVGPLQKPTVAEEEAIAFAHRLCLRARERNTTGELVGTDGGGIAGEEVASGCTASDLGHLEDRARG
jgi:hypothetical protein